MEESAHSKVARWLPGLGNWVPGQDGLGGGLVETTRDKEDIADQGGSWPPP